MILTSRIIKENLKEYSNKNTKICREIKKGNLIKIINGLYETDSSVNGYLLAGSIYGPSYLSFEFALSYYGMIPEKVICDKLYTLPPLKNKKELEIALFHDLRMDREEFDKLNMQDIEKIANAYHSTNVNLLYRYMRRKEKNNKKTGTHSLSF